jgi:hypothetical protein
MDLEKIKSFCGIVPSNYEFKMVDENTIFEVDPNFSPINLYDFWGNAATVNSFFECANYILMEGGDQIKLLYLIFFKLS